MSLLVFFHSESIKTNHISIELFKLIKSTTTALDYFYYNNLRLITECTFTINFFIMALDTKIIHLSTQTWP